MEKPPVGSLVAPSPGYRSSMGTGEGAAVLMAILRGNGKLYYPATDQTFWVPMRQVRTIPSEVLPSDSLEAFLSSLLLFLDADECSVDESGPGALRLAVEIPGLSRARFEELREQLGDRLADFNFEPRSMRAVRVELALVSLPPATGAGT